MGKIKATYYFLMFLFSLTLSFFFATYVLFLSKAGLNLLEINLINVCFITSCFLLEVPTGAIADSLGRKFSFVLSCFVLSISFLLYYVSSSFWEFVAAEVIGGLGITLCSGAFEAWMVDSIQFHDPDYDLNIVFTRGNQFDLLGVAIGSLLGADAAKGNLALPWLLSSVGIAITGIVALIIMKEKYFDKTKQSKKTLSAIAEIAQGSISYGIKNRSVFYLIIIGTLFSFLATAPNMQWQILFGKQYGIAVEKLGWIFAGIVACTAIGSEISARIGKKFKKQNGSLIFSLIFVAVGVILSGLGSSLAVVLCGFFLHELARGSFQPIKQNYLNQHIPTEQRATIISFDAMIGRIGAFFGLIVSGYLATIISIQNTWIIMAIIFIIGLAIFHFAFARNWK